MRLELMLAPLPAGPVTVTPSEPLGARHKARSFHYKPPLKPSDHPYNYTMSIRPRVLCFECSEGAWLEFSTAVRVTATDNEAIRSTVNMCRPCARDYSNSEFTYKAKHIRWVMPRG